MRKSLPSRSTYSNRQGSSPRNVTKPAPIVEKPHAVLVLRCLGGLGDMLMLTSAIRGIKEQNPDLPLIVCTTPKYPPFGCLFDLLKNNPCIDKVIGMEDLINYDFVKTYNFQTNAETNIEVNPASKTSNRIDIYCELAKVQPSSMLPVYVVSEDERKWAEEWLIKIPTDRRGILFGIHVSASVARRNWPREKVLLLSFLLTSKYPNSSVLLFEDTQYQTPEEKYPNIYHVKNMPLRQVGALVEKCDLIVVPDSSLLHIAGALQKRIVGIFGSTPPEARLNRYEKSIAVTMEYPCQPCWYDRCPSNFKCLVDITADMVLQAVEKMLVGEETKVGGKLPRKGLCIVRMGGVGDLIMLSNALRAYKEKNPNKDITLATQPSNATILKNVPYLVDVIGIPESQKLYFDEVLDLRWRVESPEVGGNLDSEVYKTQNRVDIFEKLLDVKVENKIFDLNLNPEKVEALKKIIGYDDSRWIGLQATCTSNLRTLPPEYVPKLIELFQTLPNTKIVLFGRSEFWHGRISPVKLSELSGENVINLMDKTDLEEMVALCSLMDFVVAPDSAAIHIAGALKIDCLALFGNVNPITRVKYYPTVRVLFPEGELKCLPCHDFTNPCEHYKNLSTIRQPVGGRCMRLLTPERVFETLKSIIGGNET